ncbi:TetR/AcrR family transcriptional regulator [Rhodococcus triatomae]|uniref:TetR/AcrR family transcriptional regulator n=1 Tax=Rhodococcus triatomae TaxID=300028 RepID=UPI000932D9C7|nr:TetR/AcrR family transcriptional regulator [Rhodococcus triatomae]
MSSDATAHSPRGRANRSRIIAAAIGEFAANPDASMDDVARAAGVVRRTVYGHFPNRDSLVEGIAAEATAAIDNALLTEEEPDRPELASAVFALRMWPIGDRFRILLSFARRELGEDRIRDLLAPIRNRTVDTVRRGQSTGVFSGYLDAELLVRMDEAMSLALLDEANRGNITDQGETLSVSSLVLTGITPDRAADITREARAWLDAHG